MLLHNSVLQIFSQHYNKALLNSIICVPHWMLLSFVPLSMAAISKSLVPFKQPWPKSSL